MPLASEIKTTSSPAAGWLVVPLSTVPLIFVLAAQVPAAQVPAAKAPAGRSRQSSIAAMRFLYFKVSSSAGNAACFLTVNYFACFLAHVSFNATVRLKLGFPPWDSRER